MVVTTFTRLSLRALGRELRGRGLATSVTSEATRAALELSAVASLIVREDNEPALGIYRRLGYRVHKHLKWLSIGVSLTP